MEAICSCCGRTQGYLNPLDDKRKTHVMCANCLDYFLTIWGGSDASPDLELSVNPTFRLTVGRRMVACNSRAVAVLGKSRNTMSGLLCGEFMGCDRAHLPEGCGLTVYCESCVIRRSLAITAETGKNQERVMAFMNMSRAGAPEFINLMISTRKAGDLIDLEVAGM